MTPDELTTAAVEQYLGSRDFNGLPGYVLTRPGLIDLDTLRATLRPLIEAGSMSADFGSIHPNPHIRALKDPPATSQIGEFDAATDDHFVIYLWRLGGSTCFQ